MDDDICVYCDHPVDSHAGEPGELFRRDGSRRCSGCDGGVCHGCIELGEGHTARWVSWAPDRDLNPQYADVPDVDRYGLIVDHENPRTGRPCSGAVIFDTPTAQRIDPDRARWQVHSLDPATLHLEPSILCRFVESVEHGGDGLECGDHGYIRDGRWVTS